MKKITVIDSVMSKAPPALVPEIRKFLKYTDDTWKQGQYSREKTSKEKFLITMKGRFFTGLFSCLERELKRRKIKVEVDYPADIITRPTAEPEVRGIIFRKDQLDLLAKIKMQKYSARGVIIAPTGSGKTIVACGIASMYPEERILFTCHTKELLQQTYEEFIKRGFDCGRLGNGLKEKNHRITIATVQTLARMPPEKYFNKYSVLIVDECHRVNDATKQYGKLLQNLYAPVKLGLTATEPEKLKAKKLLEGLIGPVLGKFSLEDGIQQGILAKPVLHLIHLKRNAHIATLKNYRDVYEKGVVKNRARNARIVNFTNTFTKNGNTALIIVKEIKHGTSLADMMKLKKMPVTFIHGKTPGKTRTEAKTLLQAKKTRIVICTDIWREGVNIPSLNCIVNACGGKGEVMTLQAIGRGLRTFNGKTEIHIVDFLDPYKYLAEHAIIRLSIYAREGWI